MLQSEVEPTRLRQINQHRRLWEEKIGNLQVVTGLVEPFGVVRLQIHEGVSLQQRRDLEGALLYYASAFHASRMAGTHDHVAIITKDHDNRPIPPTFRLRPPIGEMKYYQCTEIQRVVAGPSKRRIYEGGYALPEEQGHLATELLHAEERTRTEGEINSNDHVPRYTRDPNILRNPGRPVEPPVGAEVIVLELKNYLGAQTFQIFREGDEMILPFELVPSLMS